MISLPSELSTRRQFCCRDGKRPITRKPTTGNLTTAWTDPESWMTLEEAQAAQGRKYRTENKKNPGEWLEIPVNGIGYINAKATIPEDQIIGGDIDACRDPITGVLSAWAIQFLEGTQPFYTEVSPSLCGIRMFYKGRLPNRADSFTAHGSQDDLSEESKAHIIASKPKIKEILDKGEPAWNGLELYEAGRHLTLTGIDSKRYVIEDRSSAIVAAIMPMVPPKVPISDVSWVNDMEKDAAGKRLPKLSILQVINTSGWEDIGGQVRGPHPILGSVTGVNVVVDPLKNSYCWMHNGINSGGDAWVWLAHEAGVPWEVPGDGLLKDKSIREKTIDHAIKKGLVKKEDFPERIAVEAHLSLADVAISEGEGDKERWKFSPATATQSILRALKLAMCKDSDKIYYFDGQIFVPDGERIVNNILCAAGGDLATIKNKKETTTRLHDILLNYPVKFDENPYLLGVRNGVVDLRTGEFRDYKPEDLITDQIKVTYDEHAECHGFINFLSEVAPNKMDQEMLIDWFAIHGIKTMFPYVMFLNGLGRNGKGVYERVLKEFYGNESFSNMPLEELNVKNNRFAGEGLFGKRGQIVSEAGEDNVKGKRTIPTNYLKNATGDGIIDTDRKNKSRRSFKPFYKATIDSNDMPRIEDSSKGWQERFCKADLPYQYVDNPDPVNHPMERQKDPKLFDKLTTEKELSGILNLVISRTIEICKTSTIRRRSGEEMFNEYKCQSNSIGTFLDLFCSFDPMGDSKNNIFIDIVYKAYQNWCDRVVCDKVDDKRFGGAVKKFCQGRESERISVLDENGKNIKRRIYRGFIFDANRYQPH